MKGIVRPLAMDSRIFEQGLVTQNLLSRFGRPMIGPFAAHFGSPISPISLPFPAFDLQQQAAAAAAAAGLHHHHQQQQAAAMALTAAAAVSAANGAFTIDGILNTVQSNRTSGIATNLSTGRSQSGHLHPHHHPGHQGCIIVNNNGLSVKNGKNIRAIEQNSEKKHARSPTPSDRDLSKSGK